MKNLAGAERHEGKNEAAQDDLAAEAVFEGFIEPKGKGGTLPQPEITARVVTELETEGFEGLNLIEVESRQNTPIARVSAEAVPSPAGSSTRRSQKLQRKTTEGRPATRLPRV